SFRGEKRIAKNAFRLLANSIDASGALNQPDNGPRQIVVDDDGTVLQVLAFAKNVGGEQDAKLTLRRHGRSLVIAHGTKSPRKRCWIGRIASGARQSCHSAGF